MPTARPRHTITETPQLTECLDEVRAKLPKGQKIDCAELLMLGAASDSPTPVTAEQLGDRDGKADDTGVWTWVRDRRFPPLASWERMGKATALDHRWFAPDGYLA